MMDYISIGTSPTGEKCIQVGSDNYLTKAINECLIFIKQLERQFPITEELHDWVKYSVKRCPHDYGTYLDVVINYETSLNEALEYALKVEGETPELWDKEAIKELLELGLKKIKLENKDND